jgi:MoxR-like ATPase
MSLLPIKTNHKYILPALGTWKQSVHVFDERVANAVCAAWAAERPLLVRGDPGTGKSQLARAVAHACEWQFISEVITAQTDIQDLWYRFDAVSRLGQAQVLSAIGKDHTQEQIDAELHPKHYLSPGALWWAFDWNTAKDYYASSRYQQYHPNPEGQAETPKGVVLLLDEIDKADADLPNSLLETLDNARFRIPWLNQSIGYQENNLACVRPLVIITTNEERQLPAAFVRRCLVLNLELPDNETKLVNYLVERGKQHFFNQDEQPLFADDILIEAASQLCQDRLKADELGVKPPGQAEYLDILRILSRIANTEAEQRSKLAQIKDFALKKYPGMQQKMTNDEDGAV